MVVKKEDTGESQLDHPAEFDPESRREVLERMGRFAYAAPAMMLLVDPANAKDEYKVKKPKKDKD